MSSLQTWALLTDWGNSAKAILAQLFQSLKPEAITKRRQLKGTKIVITEDLTKENYLFCSRVKAHSNVEVARTRGGPHTPSFGLLGELSKY